MSAVWLFSHGLDIGDACFVPSTLLSCLLLRYFPRIHSLACKKTPTARSRLFLSLKEIRMTRPRTKRDQLTFRSYLFPCLPPLLHPFALSASQRKHRTPKQKGYINYQIRYPGYTITKTKSKIPLFESQKQQQKEPSKTPLTQSLPQNTKRKNPHKTPSSLPRTAKGPKKS